ncbi:MAG: sigma-70 factor domain-containing protein, partial [Isosphaeraceae bacterium]
MCGTKAKECDVTNYLQAYFQDISQTSLLSAAEECALAEEISQGDRDARGRM